MECSQENLKPLCVYKLTLNPAAGPPNVHLSFLHLSFSTNGEGCSSVSPQTVLLLTWLQAPCSVPSFTTAHGFPPPSFVVALSSTRKSFSRFLRAGSSSDLCPIALLLLGEAVSAISCKQSCPHPHMPDLHPRICGWPNILPHTQYYFLHCAHQNLKLDMNFYFLSFLNKGKYHTLPAPVQLCLFSARIALAVCNVPRICYRTNQWLYSGHCPWHSCNHMAVPWLSEYTHLWI